MTDAMLLHARKHQGKPPRTPDPARAAATLVDEKTAQSATQVTAGVQVTTVALSVDDQLVVKRIREGDNASSWAAPTATGLTLTRRAFVLAAGRAHAEIWTSSRVTTPGVVTVDTGTSSAIQHKSLVVEAWRGAATFDGTQRILQLVAATGIPDAAHLLSSSLDAAVVSWAVGDFAAVAPGTPTYYAGAVQQLQHDATPAAYSAHYLRQAAPLAGPQRVGMRTAVAGQTWSLVGLEVPGGVAGGSSNPRGVGETLTTGDTSSARVTTVRAAAETLTTADAIARASSRSRTTAEGLTSADTPSRTSSRARAAAETLTTADATAGVVTATTTRSTTETLTTSDGSSRAPIAYVRAAGEATSTTDSSSRSTSRARAGVEGLVTSDAPAAGISRARATAETLATSDSPSRTSSRGRAGAEALALVDVTSRSSSRGRGLAEGLTTVDSSSRVAPAKTRSTTEGLTTADTSSASTTGNLSRATSEGLTTADSPSRRVTRPRSTGETASTSDAPARRTTAPRLLGEALTLVDVAQRAQATSRTVLEVLQLADAAVATLGLPVVDVVVLAPPVGRQRRVEVGISSPRDVDLGSRPPDPTPTSRRRTVTIAGRPPEERR